MSDLNIDIAINNRPTYMKVIYLAGGCFWGIEHLMKQLDGVVDTTTGFANGKDDIASPTYEQVYTDTTGYAETVRVDYDPSIIGLDSLLGMFMIAIDPTSLNKQGEDEGTRYRTGIYYTDEADLEIINRKIAEAAQRYNRPIVVEVEPLRQFVPADESHQDYLDKNPDGYCHLPLEIFDLARRLRK